MCKSGILAFCRVRNTAQGIRNPTKDWNPESKFHWQESGIQSLESGICSLESTIQDCLGFPYLTIGRNPLGCVFPLTGQEIWKRIFLFFNKKANRFKLTIGKIRKGDSYVYFDNSRSLVFQFLVDNDLIHPYDEWDAFFHCRIKTFFHLYDSVELTTSQRPSLSIEHSFGGAIYPFIAAKKRIFRAYTSQVWVWSIWKHC